MAVCYGNNMATLLNSLFYFCFFCVSPEDFANRPKSRHLEPPVLYRSAILLIRIDLYIYNPVLLVRGILCHPEAISTLDIALSIQRKKREDCRVFYYYQFVPFVQPRTHSR